MLLELRIENLLLIERAELRPGPELNAITGETGAGKTVLAHALDLLLGGKPRSGIVRPGAREAYVEGVFESPPGLLDEPELAELRERAGARDRDLDLLAFEIEEIEALGPTEEEKAALLAERERLRRMDGLLAAA